MRYVFPFLLGGIGLMGGCAPAGPLPPPLLGPGPWGGMMLIFLGVIGVGIYILVKNIPSRPDANHEHLVETLNDIHERLKRLEEKIDAKNGKDDKEK